MVDTQELSARLRREIHTQRAFVQRIPIRMSVWRDLIDAAPQQAVRMLLIPHRRSSAGAVCTVVNGQLADLNKSRKKERLPLCTYNQSVVSGAFDFSTLVTRILPLTKWWNDNKDGIDEVIELAGAGAKDPRRVRLQTRLEHLSGAGRDSAVSAPLLWLIRILGVLGRVFPRSSKKAKSGWPSAKEQLVEAAHLFKEATEILPQTTDVLFAVSLDRQAVPCLEQSVRTVKADASRELFDIRCDRLTWAILDSGIDHSHPAFADAQGRPRVKKTLDFTRLGEMLRLAGSPDQDERDRLHNEFGLDRSEVKRFAQGVRKGLDVDWPTVAMALEVGESNNTQYIERLDPHGTQVAGILGGRRVQADDTASHPPGVCPDIGLYDLRVIGNPSGDSFTEFHIISALQYIRYLNRDKDAPVVHGVNLSLSLPHSVEDYSCGHTPICEECERLVSSGVVVIAAAGNYGFDELDRAGPAQNGGYRDLSITDPGNAAGVITVGSTHAKYPHRYGISYFSSRGPTGDGRLKPDLVAPGENVNCPSHNHGYEDCSGTSMSAPHVSGAAALLMARHHGLIGNPDRIKSILCETATDLGRTRDLQGHGLVDILRALQAM